MCPDESGCNRGPMWVTIWVTLQKHQLPAKSYPQEHAMPLTVKTIEASKSKERPYRIGDGNGLYLEVPPTGAKRWRYRFRYAGKENMISLGTYPDVTLKDARDKRDEMRLALSKGTNPADTRKEDKATLEGLNSFETIAREWHGKYAGTWTDEHAAIKLRILEANAFPWIARRAIHDITAPDILALLRRVEERGSLETAHRLRGLMGQIFRYAIATGRATHDPAADLKGALPPRKRNHFPTMTKATDIAELLNAFEGYRGSHVTRCALRLAPLTFVRPGELRQAEWEEIDHAVAEWRIPAEKMKARRVHIVPLSAQALAILEDLYPLTGNGRFLFPGVRTSAKPMSENTINAALRSLGFTKEQFTGHGFRAMASTILNEQSWNRDAIERQLAHAERNAVRAAYNHADYLEERRRMMQAWADYLDGIKKNGNVTPIRQVG